MVESISPPAVETVADPSTVVPSARRILTDPATVEAEHLHQGAVAGGAGERDPHVLARDARGERRGGTAGDD